MAARAEAFQRHQRVGFRVVGGSLTLRGVVGEQGEAANAPFDTVVP